VQISNKAGSFAILLKCLISKISIHIPTSSRRTRRICEVKSRKALNSNKRVNFSSRNIHIIRFRIFGEIAINNICINKIMKKKNKSLINESISERAIVDEIKTRQI
jgi:hypothetical protein